MSENFPCEPGLHSYVPALETCVCGERVKADLLHVRDETLPVNPDDRDEWRP